MTPAEADVLGKRIINSWRGGPPLDDWREVLGNLDEGQAGTAYAKLRGRSDNPPSVAEFLAMYRSLDTHDGGYRLAPCPSCVSGWTEATDRVWPDGRVSTQWKPCERCSAGRARSESKIWTERNPHHEQRGAA